MQSNIAAESNTASRYFPFLGILPLIAGFALVFPFPNHNESYLWLSQLDTISISDAVLHGIKPVSSFRPLGILTAWIFYRGSGGSIAAGQLLNALLSIVAWWIATRSTHDKRAFAVVAALAMTLYFPGYIFLFHIHGVFYGPLLILVAWLGHLANNDAPVRSRTMVLVYVATVTTSLFHPFALVVGAAFLGATLLDRASWKIDWQRLTTLIACVSLGVLVLVLVPTGNLGSTSHSRIVSFYTSYSQAEFGNPLAIAGIFLAFVVVASSELTVQFKATIFTVLLLLGILFWWYAWPVVLLWISTCLVQLALQRRWKFVAILAGTSILPMGAHSGSPTYTVFAILLAAMATASNSARLERKLGFLDGRTMAIAYLAAATVILLLRCGIGLPGVERAARPLLAEREKSAQLESAIAWRTDQKMDGLPLLFHQQRSNPAAEIAPPPRRYLPPTYQTYLDAFLRQDQTIMHGEVVLFMTFGGQTLDSEPLLSLPGRYAGEAHVYLASYTLVSTEAPAVKPH